MLFLKKILLLNLIGGGVSIPLIYNFAFSEKDARLLEIDETLFRWTNLLKKVGWDNIGESLSSLFSVNLSAFSKAVIENSIKQLLMRWAIEIWEHPEAYFPFSNRLNKFFFYYQVHHWRAKNDIDDLSWELLKKFFIELFFKDKGWSLLSQYGEFRKFVLKEWKKQESPFYINEWSLRYSNAKSAGTKKASKSIYQDEEKRTQNSYLFPEVEGNQEYLNFIASLKSSKTPDLSNFKRRLLTLTELKKLDDGYQLGSLLYLLQHSKNKNTNGAQNRQRRSTEKSDISSEKELDELDLTQDNSSFLWPFSSPNVTRENPLQLFLEGEDKATKDKKCVWISSSLFKSEFINSSGGSEGSKFCLFSTRILKTKESNGQSILISREKEGISFYLLEQSSSKESTKSQDNDTFDGKTIDELEPEVMSRLVEFLTRNFEWIFYRYLLTKAPSNETAQSSQGTDTTNKIYTPFTLQIKGSDSGKIGNWDFSNFFNRHSELLKASDSYLDALYWAQNARKLQENLVGVYKHAPEKFQLETVDTSFLRKIKRSLSFWQEEKRVRLNTKDGLFSPLPFKKTEGSAEEIDFKKLRSQDRPTFQPATTTRENDQQKKEREDGFFQIITKSLFDEEEKKIYSLEEKANALKTVLETQKTSWLNKHSNKNQEEQLKALFLEELFFRALIDSVISEKKVSAHSLFRLWLQKAMFDEKPESKDADSNNKSNKEPSSLLTSFVSLLEKNTTQKETSEEVQVASKEAKDNAKSGGWKSIIEEVFFQEKEETLSKEQAAFFGQTSKSTQGNNSGSTIAKNHWTLKNYYLSDAAYNSSSESFLEFISFLYSIHWLTRDNYYNLPKIINLILKKEKENKALWLVWQVELDETEREEIEKNNRREQELHNKIESLQAKFNKKHSKRRENPLFAGKTTVKEERGEKTGDYSASHSLFEAEAFKKETQQNNGEKPNSSNRLAGFSGLFSKSFSTREIDRELKEEIFTKFLNSNPAENKNYSDQNNSGTAKVQAGRYFEDNREGKEFKSNNELLDSLEKINSRQKLIKYLGEGSPLGKAIEKNTTSEITLDREKITLEELKKLLKRTLKSLGTQVAETSSQESNGRELYKLWNRFSGYLHSDSSSSPFVFHSKLSSRYFMTFLYQLNASDFEKKGIEELKENLSENTLHTLIALLASNKKIREWIYNSELIKHLNI